MRCRSAQRLLVAYQDGELSPGDKSQVQEHLASCPHCVQREQALADVTPKPLSAVRPAMDPDWSRLDQALERAWVAPAPVVRRPIPARRVMLGLYGLAVGLLLAWGLHNAVRVQALQAELVVANAVPPVEALLPASALRPASFKPPASDGKPR